MAKEKLDVKRLLRKMEFDLEIMQRIDCTKDENAEYAKIAASGGKLPEGVFQYKVDGLPIDEFYTVHDPGLTAEEKQELLLFEQYYALRTIKNCVVFFTALTVIGFVISVLALN